MRGTGGNLFYAGDMGRTQFLSAVLDGVRALEEWAYGTDRDVDFGAISVDTKRVGDRISVTVDCDLRATTPAAVVVSGAESEER